MAVGFKPGEGGVSYKPKPTPLNPSGVPQGVIGGAAGEALAPKPQPITGGGGGGGGGGGTPEPQVEDTTKIIKERQEQERQIESERAKKLSAAREEYQKNLRDIKDIGGRQKALEEFKQKRELALLEASKQKYEKGIITDYTSPSGNTLQDYNKYQERLREIERQDTSNVQKVIQEKPTNVVEQFSSRREFEKMTSPDASLSTVLQFPAKALDYASEKAKGYGTKIGEKIGYQSEAIGEASKFIVGTTPYFIPYLGVGLMISSGVGKIISPKTSVGEKAIGAVETGLGLFAAKVGGKAAAEKIASKEATEDINILAMKRAKQASKVEREVAPPLSISKEIKLDTRAKELKEALKVQQINQAYNTYLKFPLIRAKATVNQGISYISNRATQLGQTVVNRAENIISRVNPEVEVITRSGGFIGADRNKGMIIAAVRRRVVGVGENIAGRTRNVRNIIGGRVMQVESRVTKNADLVSNRINNVANTYINFPLTRVGNRIVSSTEKVVRPVINLAKKVPQKVGYFISELPPTIRQVQAFARPTIQRAITKTQKFFGDINPVIDLPDIPEATRVGGVLGTPRNKGQLVAQVRREIRGVGENIAGRTRNVRNIITGKVIKNTNRAINYIEVKSVAPGLNTIKIIRGTRNVQPGGYFGLVPERQFIKEAGQRVIQFKDRFVNTLRPLSNKITGRYNQFGERVEVLRRVINPSRTFEARNRKLFPQEKLENVEESIYDITQRNAKAADVFVSAPTKEVTSGGQSSLQLLSPRYAQSEYAGLGMYERTEAVTSLFPEQQRLVTSGGQLLIKPLQSNVQTKDSFNTKVTSSLLNVPKEKAREEFKLKIKVGTGSEQLTNQQTKLLSKFIQEQIPLLKSGLSTKTDISQKQNIKELQKLSQKLSLKTKQEQSQNKKTRLILKLPFVTTKATPKVKKVIGSKEAFDVITWKGGKELVIGKGLPVGKAKKLGVEEVLSTLRASFKLKPSGTTSQEDINFEVPEQLFTTAKRDRNRFVQKQTARFGRRSEVRAAIKSRGKVKWW